MRYGSGSGMGREMEGDVADEPPGVGGRRRLAGDLALGED